MLAWLKAQWPKIKPIISALLWIALTLLGSANLNLSGSTSSSVSVLQAQVTALQQQVTALQGQVTAQSGEIISLREQRDLLLAKVSGLETQIKQLTDENAALRPCIESLGQPRAPWDSFKCPASGGVP